MAIKSNAADYITLQIPVWKLQVSNLDPRLAVFTEVLRGFL
jgi:hypothetical protein